jgi:hypothetical protein
MTTTPNEPISDPDLAPGGDEDEPTIDPTQPGEQVTEELPAEG